MSALAWPLASNLPLKPGVTASLMAASIASIVVGICYHRIVHASNEIPERRESECNAKMTDVTAVGLDGSLMAREAVIAAESKMLLFHVRSDDPALELRLVDKVSQRWLSS